MTGFRRRGAAAGGGGAARSSRPRAVAGGSTGLVDNGWGGGADGLAGAMGPPDGRPCRLRLYRSGPGGLEGRIQRLSRGPDAGFPTGQTTRLSDGSEYVRLWLVK